MKIEKTQRNFPFAEFTDRYGTKCSIQKSSLAFENCIWLGVANPKVKILASDASKLGIDTEENTGWIEYPTPPEAHINGRMHLTQDNVRELCLYLTGLWKREKYR